MNSEQVGECSSFAKYCSMQVTGLHGSKCGVPNHNFLYTVHMSDVRYQICPFPFSTSIKNDWIIISRKLSYSVNIILQVFKTYYYVELVQ